MYRHWAAFETLVGFTALLWRATVLFSAEAESFRLFYCNNGNVHKYLPDACVKMRSDDAPSE